MITNEVLIRHNLVSKIPFKNGLSKELKVKIMSMRIDYAKVRKSFDEDIQTFLQDAASDEFKELQQKLEKSEVEETRYQELSQKLNDEYNSYVSSRSSKVVVVNDYSFTKEEYDEIVANSEVDEVEINGQSIPLGDFLEIIYNVFVKE